MKKKGFKSFLWMLLGILAGLAVSRQMVLAADSPELYLETWRTEDTSLYIYANTSAADGEEKPDLQKVGVSLGNTALPVTEVEGFSETGEGVAYVWLVDVSGSIKSDKLTKMKEYLTELAGCLGENDRVSIAALGDEVTASAFLGAAEIKTEIEAIEGSREDTNLYAGIVEALKLLDTGDHGCHKKVLVVLSDGHDEQITGITREEVDTAVKEMHIPVYTITMLDAASGSEQQEFAKILGSFARESAGGIHRVPEIEGLSLKECAEEVAGAVYGSFVITADLAAYTAGNGQAYLQVTLEGETGETARDGYIIGEQDFADALRETQEPEEETESETEEMQASTESDAAGEDIEEPEPEPGLPVWLYGAIAALILVFVLILIFILRNRKKKKMQEEERKREEIRRKEEAKRLEEARKAEEEAEKAEEEAKRLEEEKRAREEAERQEEAGRLEEERKRAEAKRQEEAKKKAVPDAVLYMTKVGLNETASYEVPLYGELTFGRTPGRAKMAFPEDGHMSGIHCSIRYENGKLILRDAGSKNGTEVNRVPIKGPYILQQDDVIYIGRTELRLYWR